MGRSSPICQITTQLRRLLRAHTHTHNFPCTTYFGTHVAVVKMNHFEAFVTRNNVRTMHGFLFVCDRACRAPLVKNTWSASKVMLCICGDEAIPERTTSSRNGANTRGTRGGGHVEGERARSRIPTTKMRTHHKTSTRILLPPSMSTWGRRGRSTSCSLCVQPCLHIHGTRST